MDSKQSAAKVGIILIIILAALLLISGCENNSGKKAENNQLVIAEQYGLAYAPVQLIKELKLLEKSESELEIEWKQFSNTASIRESMLAGKVDIAFMAIPPFLIAKDKGMDWKIISGLSESPLALMVNRDYINSLKDFRKDDKIALPQPGSIQHILLSMAAGREFDDPQRFDNKLLAMRHPDAMNALLARKNIAAHFASPPYLFLESKEMGIKEILSGKEAFGGDFTFIIGVSSSNFYQNNPKKYRLFLNALDVVLNKIENEPLAAAELLADNYNLETSEIQTYLSWPGLDYNTSVKGLSHFINFMTAEGYLTKKNYQFSDLVFDTKIIYKAESIIDQKNKAAKEVDKFEK